MLYRSDISEKRERIGMQVINPLPPISPSTGSTMSAPTPTSARPLPIRPLGSPGYPPDGPEHPLPFGNGLAPNQLPRKQPHPGPIPQLSKEHYPPFAGHASQSHTPHGRGAGGVPMQRSHTNPSMTGSVFTTSAQVHHPTTTSPPSGNANPRRRTRTTGGSIPSPYEIPENGHTLPRVDNEGMPRRPNTAHGVEHSRVQMIPPPPSHSPPPLTHSSLLFAQMNELGMGSMQNTIPRMQQRSHSTSGEPGRGDLDRQRLKQIRSAGNLQILDETGEEEKVYIRPLDSSTENSTHSGARYQGGHELMGAALNYPQNGAMYGGSIVSDYSSISEMTDPSVGPVGMPRLPGHAPPSNMDNGPRAGQRESVFSETSTETSLSINSGSVRGKLRAVGHVIKQSS